MHAPTVPAGTAIVIICIAACLFTGCARVECTPVYQAKTPNGRPFTIFHVVRHAGNRARSPIAHDGLYVSDESASGVKSVRTSTLPDSATNDRAGWYLVARESAKSRLPFKVHSHGDRIWLVDREGNEVFGAVDFETERAFADYERLPTWAMAAAGQLLPNQADRANRQ